MTHSHSATLAATVALVLLTGGCLGLLADDPSAETVEDNLRRGPAFDTVEGTYTVTETTGDGTQRATVRIWNAGERVRQEINPSTEPRRVVIANESRTWVYLPESDRAYRRGFTVLDQTGVQAYSYAALVGNLDAYRVEYRGRETVANRSTHHVELVPAADGGPLPEIEFYTYHVGAEPSDVTVRPTRVELWLDAEHWYPLRHELHVEGEDGTEFSTTIEYETVTFNGSIKPKRFRFEPASRQGVEVVMDDVTTAYRPYDSVARAEARAGVVYVAPERVDRYRLERVAVVESAEGRGIKGLYLPAGVEASERETRITRPTHPEAVTVVVSPDGTYRELTGFPRMDGENRTLGGRRVEFARLEGRWTEVTFTCGDNRYTVTGNGGVDRDTMRRFAEGVNCP